MDTPRRNGIPGSSRFPTNRNFQRYASTPNNISNDRSRQNLPKLIEYEGGRFRGSNAYTRGSNNTTISNGYATNRRNRSTDGRNHHTNDHDHQTNRRNHRTDGFTQARRGGSVTSPRYRDDIRQANIVPTCTQNTIGGSLPELMSSNCVPLCNHMGVYVMNRDDNSDLDPRQSLSSPTSSSARSATPSFIDEIENDTGWIPLNGLSQPESSAILDDPPKGILRSPSTERTTYIRRSNSIRWGENRRRIDLTARRNSEPTLSSIAAETPRAMPPKLPKKPPRYSQEELAAINGEWSTTMPVEQLVLDNAVNREIAGIYRTLGRELPLMPIVEVSHGLATFLHPERLQLMPMPQTFKVQYLPLPQRSNEDTIISAGKYYCAKLAMHEMQMKFSEDGTELIKNQTCSPETSVLGSCPNQPSYFLKSLAKLSPPHQSNDQASENAKFTHRLPPLQKRSSAGDADTSMMQSATSFMPESHPQDKFAILQNQRNEDEIIVSRLISDPHLSKRSTHLPPISNTTPVGLPPRAPSLQHSEPQKKNNFKSSLPNIFAKNSKDINPIPKHSKSRVLSPRTKSYNTILDGSDVSSSEKEGRKVQHGTLIHL